MFKLKKLWMLRVVTIFVIIFAVISSFILGLNITYIRTPVTGGSMLPTLNSYLETTGKQDVVYVNRFVKGKVGDIIVMDMRSNPNFAGYTIKRLMAQGGDVINIIKDDTNRKYDVVVNASVVYSKPYQDGGSETYERFLSNIINNSRYSNDIIKDGEDVVGFKVPRNQVFVMGDNWNGSKDSATHGPFNEKYVVGRVDIVVNPHQNEFLQVIKRIF